VSFSDRDGAEGRAVEAKYIPCGVNGAECPSCHQPVLITSTGPRPLMPFLLYIVRTLGAEIK